MQDAAMFPCSSGPTTDFMPRTCPTCLDPAFKPAISPECKPCTSKHLVNNTVAPTAHCQVLAHINYSVSANPKWGSGTKMHGGVLCQVQSP